MVILSGLSPAAMRRAAALSGPMPTISSGSGRWALTVFGHPAGEFLDLAGQVPDTANKQLEGEHGPRHRCRPGRPRTGRWARDFRGRTTTCAGAVSTAQNHGFELIPPAHGP